ncbi:hypothetical protein GCM10027592_56830 [Spirosoma flavus]
MHARAYGFDDAGELMAKGHAYPGIGHATVIEVQVGSAHQGSGDPDNSIIRMLDLGFRLVPVYPDLPGPAKIHCYHSNLGLNVSKRID